MVRRIDAEIATDLPGFPSAYDEQYTLLLRELPQSLHRVPAAMRAKARHAFDTAEWGWFWPATAMASVAIIDRRVRPLMIVPLVVLTMMLAMYIATFTVTSWNVDELANAAARRLLSQLIIPACCILAAATRAITNDPSRRSPATLP